jgi:hypothetical protein
MKQKLFLDQVPLQVLIPCDTLLISFQNLGDEHLKINNEIKWKEKKLGACSFYALWT